MTKLTRNQTQNENQSAAEKPVQCQQSSAIVDHRPAAQLQQQISETIHSSSRQTLQRKVLEQVAQKQGGDGDDAPQGRFPIQRQENKTGMPDQLKSGIESLSGHSMDNVKVHYNSSKPAQLNALAYAQGNDIHLGSGQEQHLPHEAWHVVQQAQGRVKPTTQLAGAAINDDKSLESEADAMGAKATQMKVAGNSVQLKKNSETQGGCKTLSSFNRAPYVSQLQLDTAHVNAGGRISFYRFNSVNTDNYVDGTKDAAEKQAMTRLGATGKKKIDKNLTTGGAQRNGNYKVFAFDSDNDKVLVEHDQDDQAIVYRYHNWRSATKIGEKDRFDAVPHFHAATIPKVEGNNKSDYAANLGDGFPAYDAIGGGHHFYYINIAAPSVASGHINIPQDEIDRE